MAMTGAHTVGRLMDFLVRGQQLDQLAGGNAEQRRRSRKIASGLLHGVQHTCHHLGIGLRVGPDHQLPAPPPRRQDSRISHAALGAGEAQTQRAQGVSAIAQALTMVLTLHDDTGRHVHETHG